MSRAAKYELEKLVKQRLKGVPEGQELCILCHPSRKSDAEDFARSVEAGLPTGETVAVVADPDCPVSKFYPVNRDYYDHFDVEPWEAFGQ